MNKTLIPLISFFFILIFLCSGVYAYILFNQNSYFTINNNGYYIADKFTNSSCWLWWCTNNSYSCFDIENTNGKLILSNSSRCDYSLNYNFAGLVVKMLSDDSYYKMDNGDYQQMVSMQNSKWCDQLDISPFGVGSGTPPFCLTYDYIVLPKNKGGIVVLNYSLTDNSYLDGSYTLLEVWENGITQINKTLIWYGGNNQVILNITPKTYDRNLTIFASWKWYTNVPIPIPITNITIDEFEFYTLDANEIRTDFTNDADFEIEKYCGVGSIITDYQNKTNFSTNTGWIFGLDKNGLDCGLIKLDNLIIARQWKFYDYAIASSDNICFWNFFYSSDNLFFVYDKQKFAGFFETILRTQIKFTNMYNNTYHDAYIEYDDIYNTKINISSLMENYSTAFRETINLTNNPNINISNQNPSGSKFRYYTICNWEGLHERPSLWHEFFSSNIQVDNAGWSCSPITNSEQYILTNSSAINVKYCGDFGCNDALTHCNFHHVGTYCTDNNYWASSDELGIKNTGSCLPYTCFNKTTTTIECIDINGDAIQCINELGAEISCSELTQNQLQTEINNCLAKNDYYCSSALSVFSLIGITNKGLSESFLSLMITSVISIVVLFLGKRSKFGVEGFLVSVFLFLTGFTLIGKFNPIIWILLIIADGYMLYHIILGGKH